MDMIDTNAVVNNAVDQFIAAKNAVKDAEKQLKSAQRNLWEKCATINTLYDIGIMWMDNQRDDATAANIRSRLEARVEGIRDVLIGEQNDHDRYRLYVDLAMEMLAEEYPLDRYGDDDMTPLDKLRQYVFRP